MKDQSPWPYDYLTQAAPFNLLHSFIQTLGPGEFPELAQLNALLESQRPAIHLRSGRRLRFVPQSFGNLTFEEQYEPRCYIKGELQTRDNWHDLFNALVWMRYPQAKAALNARHFALLESFSVPAQGRGATRDMATLLDESGVVVACADAEFGKLLREFRWKELFWGHRKSLLKKMDFCVFGHGLYEKLLHPYLGLTGQGLIIEVPPDYFEGTIAQRAAYLDGLLTTYIDDPQHCKRTSELTPVPLLGIPGWDANNAQPAYYDNTAYFRPGRRSQPLSEN